MTDGRFNCPRCKGARLEMCEDEVNERVVRFAECIDCGERCDIEELYLIQRDEAENAADAMASLVLGEAVDWPLHDVAWQAAIDVLKDRVSVTCADLSWRVVSQSKSIPFLPVVGRFPGIVGTVDKACFVDDHDVWFDLARMEHTGADPHEWRYLKFGELQRFIAEYWKELELDDNQP